MKRSVEAGRRAEKRTEDYKNDIVRTRGENKLASPTPSSHGSSTLRNYDYKASINTSRKGISMIEEESDEEISLSSKDLHEIKTTMSEVYDLKQKLADVLQREQKIREDMRTGDEENKIYLDMMQNEVEDTKRKTKNDSELFDSEIWSMKTELENQTTSNQKKEGIIKNISELVAALVEFDLIAQALISQDEESRTMNTHVKPVEISSQNLPVITPRRIATAAIDNPLQSNSFQSLKQPTIQPSYKYRNKLYTRNELLDI